MATITWIGGVSNEYSNPSNWDLLRVPENGDDVLFNGTSSNPCVLNVDTPANGRLKTFKIVGFTGNFDFNNRKIYVGGAVNDYIIDIDTNAAIQGNGAIRIYSSTTVSGYNKLNLSNQNLMNVDFEFEGSGNLIVATIQSAVCYMNNYITVGNYPMRFLGVNGDIHIYGDMTGGGVNSYVHIAEQNSIVFRTNGNIYFEKQNAIIDLDNPNIMTNKGVIFNNLTLSKKLNIIAYDTGAVTLSDFGLSGDTIYGDEINIMLNLVRAVTTHVLFRVNINNIETNKCNISFVSAYLVKILLNNNININSSQFIIEGSSLTSSVGGFSVIEGQNYLMTLGENTKYSISNIDISNLNMNKPITILNSIITNCNNLINFLLPYVKKCVF